MEQVDISSFLSLLKGSFSYWIWNELGILVSFLISCGLLRLRLAFFDIVLISTDLSRNFP